MIKTKLIIQRDGKRHFGGQIEVNVSTRTKRFNSFQLTKKSSGCCKGSGVGEVGHYLQPTMGLGVRGIPTHLEIRLIMIPSSTLIEREREREKKDIERDRSLKRYRWMDRSNRQTVLSFSKTVRQTDRQTDRLSNR